MLVLGTPRNLQFQVFKRRAFTKALPADVNFIVLETDPMGFLSKLFGKKEEEKAAKVKASRNVEVKRVAKEKSIPAEKVGIDGDFDENGLAKRVAMALDDANISDDVGLWVAQRGSTVVLKYNEDAKSVLDKAEQTAKRVDGATAVETVPNS